MPDPQHAGSSALFVTGTDTDVGKTFVCGLLLGYLRGEGIAAGYQKWVSTGGEGLPADLAACLEAAGLPVAEAVPELQTPYRFRLPASPHLAAEAEGRSIEPDLILARFRELAARHPVLIVEGVGGLLVPVRRDLLLANLLARLALPTLVVARSGLGTLNHTLLTLEALRARAVPVLGVVCSDSGHDEDERIAADNLRTIADMGKVTVFGRLPRCRTAAEAAIAFRPVGDAIRKVLCH
ncbi:MAG: dethiobiotin synthase [Desulfobacteraceae bacterium]|nr:dethiobiotin synthase [Desulfobacteraceae bacterium]